MLEWLHVCPRLTHSLVQASYSPPCITKLGRSQMKFRATVLTSESSLYEEIHHLPLAVRLAERSVALARRVRVPCERSLKESIYCLRSLTSAFKTLMATAIS